jgi:hypothetical protein
LELAGQHEGKGIVFNDKSNEQKELYGRAIEIGEAKDSIKVFLDQQNYLHLSDHPYFVLDLEWPGFVTK